MVESKKCCNFAASKSLVILSAGWSADLCGLGFDPTPIEAEPKYYKCLKFTIYAKEFFDKARLCNSSYLEELKKIQKDQHIQSSIFGEKMPKTTDYHEIRAWRKRRSELLMTYVQQLDILEELLMNAVISEYEAKSAEQQ